MANPRVHEIASELGVESRVVLERLKVMGEFVKGPSSSISFPVARRVKASIADDRVVPIPSRLITAVAAAVRGLPASLPQLAESVSAALSDARSPAQLALHRAIGSRVFYYTDLAVTTSSLEQARSLDEYYVSVLPAPAGLLIMRTSPVSVTAIGWNLSERLHVASAILTADNAPVLSRVEQGRSSAIASGLIEVRTQQASLLGAAMRSIPARAMPARANSARIGEARPQPDHSNDVRVLHASRGGESTRRSGSSGIHRTKSWDVRGHTRNQWYATLQTHKPIWIDSHAAGPRDGERVRHDIVYVIKPTPPT